MNVPLFVDARRDDLHAFLPLLFAAQSSKQQKGRCMHRRPSSSNPPVSASAQQLLRGIPRRALKFSRRKPAGRLCFALRWARGASRVTLSNVSKAQRRDFRLLAKRCTWLYKKSRKHRHRRKVRREQSLRFGKPLCRLASAACSSKKERCLAVSSIFMPSHSLLRPRFLYDADPLLFPCRSNRFHLAVASKSTRKRWKNIWTSLRRSSRCCMRNQPLTFQAAIDRGDFAGSDGCGEAVDIKSLLLDATDQFWMFRLWLVGSDAVGAAASKSGEVKDEGDSGAATAGCQLPMLQQFLHRQFGIQFHDTAACPYRDDRHRVLRGVMQVAGESRGACHNKSRIDVEESSSLRELHWVPVRLFFFDGNGWCLAVPRCVSGDGIAVDITSTSIGRALFVDGGPLALGRNFPLRQQQHAQRTAGRQRMDDPRSVKAEDDNDAIPQNSDALVRIKCTSLWLPVSCGGVRTACFSALCAPSLLSAAQEAIAPLAEAIRNAAVYTCTEVWPSVNDDASLSVGVLHIIVEASSPCDGDAAGNVHRRRRRQEEIVEEGVRRNAFAAARCLYRRLAFSTFFVRASSSQHLALRHRFLCAAREEWAHVLKELFIPHIWNGDFTPPGYCASVAAASLWPSTTISQGCGGADVAPGRMTWPHHRLLVTCTASSNRSSLLRSGCVILRVIHAKSAQLLRTRASSATPQGSWDVIGVICSSQESAVLGRRTALGYFFENVTVNADADLGTPMLVAVTPAAVADRLVTLYSQDNGTRKRSRTAAESLAWLCDPGVCCEVSFL